MTESDQWTRKIISQTGGDEQGNALGLLQNPRRCPEAEHSGAPLMQAMFAPKVDCRSENLR
jgi:hypothetical protein